jgi:2-keto-4-pentenoate hydratase
MSWEPVQLGLRARQEGQARRGVLATSDSLDRMDREDSLDSQEHLVAPDTQEPLGPRVKMVSRDQLEHLDTQEPLEGLVLRVFVVRLGLREEQA